MGVTVKDRIRARSSSSGVKKEECKKREVLFLQRR